MAGRAEWEVQVNSNIKQLLGDANQLRSELNDIKNGKYKVELDIDSKKLEKVISNLDKMLDNLGKGTGNFKQFKTIGESLAKLSSGLSEFKNINSTFASIESSLSALKATIHDVGDGQEFSPLLKMINEVKTSIGTLEKTASKMKFDFKLDLGSDVDERKTQKIVKARTRQLDAYRDLFNKIKTKSKSTGEIFNFYEPDNASVEEKISMYDSMIRRAEKEYGKYYKKQFGDSYKHEIELANRQYQNATRIKKTTANDNPLENLFGKTDLKPVIDQLDIIAQKLDEISKEASEFKNIFSSGLNVNTSIAEVEKLTNKIQELENELNAIKNNSLAINANKTNILSNNLSGNTTSAKSKIDKTVNSAKQLGNILSSVNISTESFDDVLKKLDLSKSELSDIVKITKQAHADGEGKFYNSYTLTDKYGSSEIYGENSQTDRGQLLKYNYVKLNKKQSEDEALKVNQELVKADNELRKLRDTKREILGLDANASTSNIDEQISKQKEYIRTLEETRNKLKETNEFVRDDKSLFDDRQKSKEEYNLNKGIKQEKVDASDRQKQITKDWNEALKVNQELKKTQRLLDNLDSRKSVNSGLASDFESIKNNVSDLNKKLVQGTITIENYKNKISDRVSNYSKKIKKEEDTVKDKLNKAQKLLESGRNDYNSKIAGRPNSPERSYVYNNHLKDYEYALNKLDNRLKELSSKDIVNSEDIADLKGLTRGVKEAENAIKGLSAAEKGTTGLSAAKEIDTMTKYLNKFTGISKDARKEIEALIKSLKFNPSDTNTARTHENFLNISSNERVAGREVSGLKSIISEKMRYGLGADIANMIGLNDIINVGRQAIDIITELDYALIDLEKTTAMSSSEMESFYLDSNDVAKQMGVSTKEIIEQASSWSRLGYNTKEASTEMAKLSSQFASISPGMDTDTSQEGLVSIMKAWDIDVSKVKSEIMDNVNALGNNMAFDNQDIVEGMKRSAAALASVGTSYTDAFALFSGIQEVLQNPEVSGRALKSISMRLRGYDEETEELSSDLDNITGELIDLTKTAEHAQGVSIFKEGSTTEFKSLVDYFREINAVWDEMSEKQQNDFLQKAFGKTQAKLCA